MTLDGPVTFEPPRGSLNKYDDATQGALSASYASISHNMMKASTLDRQRQYAKDRIHSLSRFYILKGAEKLKSHYTQNKDRLELVQQEKVKQSNVKLYGASYSS